MNAPKNYRKRPVVIEAWQLTPENLLDVMGWADAAYGIDGLSIHTLEGTHKADFGDYVIRGVKGEHYPCKPDIFELTYEAVKETS